ncbi:MAG: ion channel [Solirubrobacterales bacterium]
MNRAAIRDRRRQRWIERAERVRDEFGLVLLLVLTTYVLMSLLGDRGWPSVLICVVTSATSVIALTSSHVRHQFVRLAIVFSLLSVAMAAVAAISGALLWLNVSGIIQVLLLVAATGAVLLRVVTTAEVNSRTILGAISVYTVLGILFTYVFATIDRLQTGPFFEGVPHPQPGDFLFFSYTTLTTTGYGDLVPGGQPGRLVTGLEMMAGQIFLVTLVAGLVALWRPGEALRRRREARSQDTQAGAE